MRLSGKELNVGDTPIKGEFYQFKHDRSVSITEENGDTAVIQFRIKQKQNGYFGNEYHSGTIDENDTKKVDILALVVDEKQKCYEVWLLDMKAKIAKDDVIFKLIKQIKTSWFYKNQLRDQLQFSDDGEIVAFREKSHLGFITREYDEENIKNRVQERLAIIEREQLAMRSVPALLQANIGSKLARKQKELEELRCFSEKNIVIGGQLYPLECHLMAPQPDGNYLYQLEVSC